jgi:hypothetical protein
MVVAALVLAAAALWGSSRLTWFAEDRDAGVRGIVHYTENGAQLAGSLVPLALLALAGVAGMVATGGWFRRVLGGLLALGGLAACWAGIDGFGHASGFPFGPLVAVLGGILMISGGLLGIKGASRMPRLGTRYAAPATKRVARDPDVELWEALSEGEDPTQGR